MKFLRGHKMKQQFTDCCASCKLTFILRHSVCNIMGSPVKKGCPHLKFIINYEAQPTMGETHCET
jgi:hypothetical protein